MNQVGRMRSGSGLWAMRRASTRASTMGQKKAPMPICAADHTVCPSGRPASGATTLPTTGISSTGVTVGHRPVLPGPCPGVAGASQRPSTQTVAQSWVSAPSHHSAFQPALGPISATPAAASSSTATGKAATKAWRAGCLRSSASAAG